MLADDRAILADHNEFGIGLDLNRSADCARGDRVLVVVEPHQAGLRDRDLRRVEAIERLSSFAPPDVAAGISIARR
jgi:hypothetical protein